MSKDLFKKILLTAEALEFVNLRSRDNTRTPFPWNDGENAGFSKHKHWLKLVENF